MLKKDDQVTIEIEDIGTDGAGIGKADGYTLFVKDAVIGDIIKAKVIKAKKTYGYARLMEIITASKDRVEPVCPVARQCGGCQIQQMSYSAQLKYKQKLVRDNLARIGGITDCEVLPVIGMENPFNYRNKAQYPVGRNKDGKVVIGLYAGRTHSIVDYTQCAIGAPENAQILEKIRTFINENNISVYDEQSHKGLIRHILIRTGKHTGQIMVCLIINGKTLPHADKLADCLKDISGMSSIMININKERKVSVWLGDLGRIPFEEQKYWRTFNIKPEGKMDSKFVDRQIRGIWTDASRIESKLVPSLNRFNAMIKEQYGDVIFNVLSDADKEIYNTFMIPTNYSIPEYQSFLMKLSKLTVESINVKLIKKAMGDEYEKEAKGNGSIFQLGVFLKYAKIDDNEKVSNSLKKAYNSRNKLSGHTASFGEYNKIWGRDKEYKFNSVEDARSLIEEIVSAIEYVITDYEARKDETNGD